jgi:hypothetical protein
MKVNVDKTKIMIFSKGRMPVNLQFKYNGKDIEIAKDFNYLGIKKSAFVNEHVSFQYVKGIK